MFKPTLFTAMLLVAMALFALSAGAADVKTLLKEADACRLATESARVDTEVRVIKAGKLDKTRLYTVYV